MWQRARQTTGKLNERLVNADERRGEREQAEAEQAARLRGSSSSAEIHLLCFIENYGDV